VLAAALAIATALMGCGLKGPLYLPEKSREVIIRPAPGTPPEAPTAIEVPPAADPTVDPTVDPGAAPEVPTDGEAPPPGNGDG
jgi:predicted small lipoprotein YifL